MGDLLDYLDAGSLFSSIVEESYEVLNSLDDLKEYIITIDYERNSQRIIAGRFNQNDLPDDFEDFVEMVFHFIHLSSIGELFNPSVYQKSRRLKNEYGFCSVVFDKEQKSYYYLTDKDDIAIGGEVIVPVGATNHETIAEVAGIEYYNKEEAPIAIGKIKWIIRKKSEKNSDYFDKKLV